jgi:hypothetical protein
MNFLLPIYIWPISRLLSGAEAERGRPGEREQTGPHGEAREGEGTEQDAKEDGNEVNASNILSALNFDALKMLNFSPFWSFLSNH